MGSDRPEPREIVAGLLDDQRLQAACAERDMGALFRLLNHRGVSTRRLAAAADIAQGRLYDYMNGKSRVEKLALFEQIADAFHIPGQLLGLTRRAWEPPTAEAPYRDVEVAPDGSDLTAMDAFRAADRRTGGGRLYGAVVQHLSDHVAPRLVDADSEPVVFAAAAALTEMAGWMAHDSGRDDLARRHFARALPLARASDDVPLAAHVAASSSHLALQTGAPAAATQNGHGPDSIWRAEVRGFRRWQPGCTPCRPVPSPTSQHAPAVRALDQARTALDASADAEHPWLSPFDAAALAGESALALSDLEQYDQALAHAEDAVRLREDSRARSLALSRITLIGIHVGRQQLDAAVSVGHDLLKASPTLGSVRVARQLDDLRRLLEPHSAYPPVREYLTLLDDARRARTLLLADIVTDRGGVAP